MNWNGLDWLGLAWKKWFLIHFDTDFDTSIIILIQVLIQFDTTIFPTNQKIPPKMPSERIKKKIKNEQERKGNL